MPSLGLSGSLTAGEICLVTPEIKALIGLHGKGKLALTFHGLTVPATVSESQLPSCSALHKWLDAL